MPRIDEVVAAYIKLRDFKKEVKVKHQEELAPTNEKMQKIEAWFLQRMLDTGETSMKTGEGTAYQTKVSTYKVQEWDVFSEWVAENGLVDMFEKKASKSAVDDWIESTGELPPGLSVTTQINARVRK